MTTFDEAFAYIANEATEEQIRAIFHVGNARIKNLRAVTAAANIANLSPGTTVRLQNLKPKYLNGLTGTVQAVEGDKVRVKLDDVSALQAGRYVSFDHTLSAPASTVAIVD